MNAFSRYFPGPEALKDTADISGANEDSGFRSQRRFFTRLTPTASWGSEYLVRTRLLRCLTRGRPSLPFAAPCPGKPGRGSATFTFSSRLSMHCSNLEADFGSVLDKRKPQFIHGLDRTGSVNCSDRKGKLENWGFLDRVAFRHFSERHPGSAPWGLGSADVVGVPNRMDLSHRYGMIYGEGTLGGTVFHLGIDEKRGGYLSSFTNVLFSDMGVPKIDQDHQSTCSVWIAKTPAIPQLTRGMIGMLSGSSCGVVSSYSLGTTGFHDQRYARGQLTGRWLLSPGIPIISVVADDEFSEERNNGRRIWVVALNALGEVFYLSVLPSYGSLHFDSEDQTELLLELAAWRAGQSARWALLGPSQRSARYSDSSLDLRETIPSSVFVRGDEFLGGNIRPIEIKRIDAQRADTWIVKKPFEIKAYFNGWDMRRRLEVDFAGYHGMPGGEGIIVIECGLEDEGKARIKRYNRSQPVPHSPSENQSDASPKEILADGSSRSLPRLPRQAYSGVHDCRDLTESAKYIDSEDEWWMSKLMFGPYKGIKITTSTIDSSAYALTTRQEDVAAQNARNAKIRSTVSSEFPKADNLGPLQLAGQRARLLAVGTAGGTIFLWDARSCQPSNSLVTSIVPPLRVIETDSPGISSLALTALYLVHGGEEGLVQAWDPLASTLGPLRTLSSRHAINNRRRVVLAAQQNQAQQAQNHANLPSLAASAIRLDPDPTVLRGIVALGPYLKYFSYSSISAIEDLSKSQKRRLKRAATRGGPKASQGEHFTNSRRVGLKGFVSQEMLSREMDERERQQKQKENQKFASRFGLDLLGSDAGEEEMLAYAKMLSEEERERERTRATEEVPLDAEKWRFASWQQRFEMAGAVALTDSQTPTPTLENDSTTEDELDKAMELSLKDERQRQLSSATTTSSSKSENALEPAAAPSSSFRVETLVGEDAEVAEAIARSLVGGGAVEAQGTAVSRLGSAFRGGDKDQEDDDVARAIKLSLQHQQHASRSSRSVSPEDHNDFPTLSSSLAHGTPKSGSGSGSWSSRKSGKGKGKRIA